MMKRWQKGLAAAVTVMALWGCGDNRLQAEPLAVVQENDLCGVINTQGKFLVPLGYDRIIPWTNGALMVKKGDNCGVLGRDGAVIVPVEYLSILIPHHGKTYLVENNEAHWGAYDNSGQLLLPVIYDEITAVTENNDCFAIRQGTEYHLVKRDGSQIGTETFDYIGEFNEEELAPVRKKDKWGYINAKGQIAIALQYEGAKDFSGGLAAVKQQGSWGFIDKLGIMKIQPQFSEVFSGFSESLAAVQSPQGKGYIDKHGILLLPRDSRYLGPFKNGVAEIHEVKKKLNVWSSLAYGASIALGGIGLPPKNALKSNEKRGFINRQGKEIVSTSFDEVMPFADDMSVVRKDKKWGAISRDGKNDISPRYLAMRSFGEGVAAVYIGSGWQIIDKSGRTVKELPAEVTDAGVMSEGLLPVCIGGKWGYVNKEGTVVIAPNFGHAGSFTDKLKI